MPATLRINAWDEKPASGSAADSALGWSLRDRLLKPPRHLLPKPLDPNDWRDPRIGWGLILPEPPDDHGLSAEALGTADDQPKAIRRLLRHRAVDGVLPPVFRFRADRPMALSTLRHWPTDQDRDISGAGSGLGSGRIPYYLLIYGSPSKVPWELQYLLNTRCCVGRLDLADGEGLDHYVDALVDNAWPQSAHDWRRVVTWAVNHGADDITDLMRNGIAKRVADAYERDPDLQSHASFVDGSMTIATVERLLEELRPVEHGRSSPSVIVTTSHGLTDRRLSQAEQKTALGLLVDQNGRRLPVEDLLAAWEPDGAIWYAHACCSAGSADVSQYEGLVSKNSEIAAVLRTVTDFASAAGATVAHLPRRLLGAARPLRAFVGHVEPTFDWTLRNQKTGQYLADDLRHALYTELFGGATVGHAFRRWYHRVAAVGVDYEHLRIRFSAGEDVSEDLLAMQLVQRDIVSTVILGDPAVRLRLPQG